MSHIALTRVHGLEDSAAGTMSRNEKLRKARPSVNFVGLEGSRDPSLIHNHAKKRGEKNHERAVPPTGTSSTGSCSRGK